MFEAKISPLGKNSTVNFCESQLIAFTGSNLAGKSNLTLKDTSVVNQAEKLQFVNVELSVPPYATATYTILITITGKLKTEPCSVDYLLTENNSTKNVSKTPVVTIEKVEPRNSQPTVNFSTIVEVRVKFIEDFVYMPITFQLQVNSNEAIIIRQSIQTIGYLLKAVALVGYDFSVKPYVRVDYGPLCTINRIFYCTLFKHTLYVMGDCNATTTINYAFPTFVNISGSTKNFTAQTLVLSPIPSFPIYTDIMIEVSPSSVTLQPGTVSVPIMRNTLSLSVDIQLSDSKIVENGTVWPLQITGRFNAVTNISKVSVSCVRTGSEKPSIHVVLSQLSSFTFSDYPDRDVVYLQTTVQMMNGTGLECERQSIIFYLSPEIKSISLVNQTGNIDNVTLKTPLNPVTKSVQFIAGRLYFGAKYEVIFSLKFNPSLSTTIVKYPILVEIVCKPYERGSPVVNSCAKQKFYKFKSHLRVQLDHTYPYNLPHYVAMRNPLVQLPDRQANTFLNVGDLLFYCARAFSIKGSLDLVRRCFKISKLP
ncbi:jumonji domain-containing protein 6 [Schistosoma haematobium]|uniref:Jumonji domain-containing protein 6 n=1 Tax=Schistosoma haematobium TaxID=6185 RepID=A0A922IPV0_SCHHA|nr:jumonji domain-containing protein 6 [Schistosoma haematobium]KAH9583405.1 jumonji domain-containing protein 6 [Schistosoma haematobium]